MTRTFEDRPATREKTPLLVGLIGPSGGGKTYSALRVATGIQRVSGGDIFVVDTEARRSLHYADRFKFRHVAFGKPFGPLDYLDVIEHCVARGAGTILVDSMSHEHEGPGGVLEIHDAEVARLSKGDAGKAENVKMLAWGRPKSERRRLINAILQMNTNFVFCFRAKKKLEIVTGKKPVARGFQPIAGEEFVFEMTLKCLLKPGANGTPTWKSAIEDEQLMIKLPEQFRAMFAKDPQLTEDIGQMLATWSAGGSATLDAPPAQQQATADELVKRYDLASDPATVRVLEDLRGASWKALSKVDKERVKGASDAAKKRVDLAASAPPAPPVIEDHNTTGSGATQDAVAAQLTPPNEAEDDSDDEDDDIPTTEAHGTAGGDSTETPS